MPLIHSGSRGAISQNIHEMMTSGHPHAQAVAAALSTADRYAKRREAGGSTGTPTAPVYKTAEPNFLGSGLMPVNQVGSFGLDTQTGALTPAAQSALQTYAQRGLPISNASALGPSGPSSGDIQRLIDQMHEQDQINNNTGGYNSSLNGGGGPEKRGGRLPRNALANGGVPSASQMAPWFVHREASNMGHPAGLVHTAGPGRTDNVPMSVAAGSHVIPADVMAGLGEGNTLAGAHAMDAAMHGGPGGIRLPKGPARSTIPHAPPAPRRAGGRAAITYGGAPLRIARGGAANGVKCIVAGGEYIVPPHEVGRVQHAGKAGHDALDAWILERRKADVDKLKKLPGPVK